ncbi:MAG: NAD(P)-dependent alcohol dehydrogenase [Anaerolineaceae bacterium]|nr:NAD(P)-dependent alcohol dehydrogenase [Anaerolineaceae bacterium]
MKAVVYEKYGAPDVLHLKEVAKPVLRDNDVLVKVATTTVTAGDTRMRSFNVPPSYWLPARIALGFWKPKISILGMEMAGEIEAVGKNVTRFKKGDLVLASTLEHGMKGYAEYICLPEDGVMAAFTNLTCEEAVTLPVGARTALYFLREANVQKGANVLIYGASGSVGTFAVQLARHFGATVTGVCSAANLELVKSLGADRVIDYTKEDFTQETVKYDVIFDTVGKIPYSSALHALKEDGAYLQAVASPGISLRMWWTARTSRKRTVGGGPPPNPADLRCLIELMEAGQIQAVIDKRYPLDQITAAHRYVDTGRKKGNVIILMESS